MYLTVFTPTYNRGHLLARAFDSLKAQKITDFEWLIVDDGSNDSTNEIVSSFKEIAPFKITYLYKQNGGKHTAINLAAQRAAGDFILWLDSDDRLLPNKLHLLEESILKYQNDKKVGSILYLRLDEDHIPLGRNPNGNLRGNYVTVFNSILRGEYAWCIRKLALQKYPYPIFNNEKFMTEGVSLLRMSAEYDLIFINESLEIGGYIEGGLTHNMKSIIHLNPQGFLLFYKEMTSFKGVSLRKKLLYNFFYWRIYTKV
ncbi:glycosyltransferase family A protein, partial [Parabacteroides sp.]